MFYLYFITCVNYSNLIFYVEFWPSIKCHIHTFLFTLFIDDIGFSSKAVISITLDNIAATLGEIQVNQYPLYITITKVFFYYSFQLINIKCNNKYINC